MKKKKDYGGNILKDFLNRVFYIAEVNSARSSTAQSLYLVRLYNNLQPTSQPITAVLLLASFC